MLNLFDPRTDFMHRPLRRLFDTEMLPWTSNFAWLTGREDNTMFTLPVGRGWTDEALNLRVVMPAVGDKDFTVTVKGNQLSIRGERKLPDDFGREGDVYYTLPYGHFEKLIELPAGLNLDQMECKLHHGVLDIHIPFTEAVKTRTVPVIAEKEAAFAAA